MMKLYAFVGTLGLFLLSGCGGGSDGNSTDVNAQPSPSSPVPSNSATATYAVTFQTTWTQDNFPTNYPIGRHFSSLVGMTHSEQSALWIAAGIASNGVEAMAEDGVTNIINAEIDRFIEQGFAENRINGGGISAQDTSTQLQFNVSRDFPLLSLVSMVAPSPDWFVGVRDLNLLDEQGNWRSSVVMQLPVYDAGTDSGRLFFSRNDNTTPRDPILRLDSNPDETDFLNGIHRDNGRAIASFTITLVR